MHLLFLSQTNVKQNTKKEQQLQMIITFRPGVNTGKKETVTFPQYCQYSSSNVFKHITKETTASCWMFNPLHVFVTEGNLALLTETKTFLLFTELCHGGQRSLRGTERWGAEEWGG